MEIMNVVFAAILWHVCHGFILDMNLQCPAHKPCRCYGSVIDCGSIRLDVFPGFTFSGIHFREFTIRLQRNRFTSIPADAFSDILTTGAKELEIHMENNRINAIDENAFVGLGNMSISIDMSENNLTSVPRALAKISNLKSLRLVGNHIVYFDSSVTSVIGRTLETLTLDMGRFAIWPRQFSDFTVLNELHLENVPFHSLPDTAFAAFTRLTRFQLINTKLNKIPDALCSLRQLQNFEFSENMYLSNFLTEIFPDCPSKLQHVTSVTLHENNLRKFPYNVFNLFPILRTLGLYNNKLDTIEESRIPTNCSLYYLYMSNNRFYSIPHAVARMPLLLTLIMNDNHITQVGADLFSGLPYFRQLTLNNNPVSYVDPHAFNTNYTLTTLHLENSNMTTIPAAILHSKDRVSVDLLNAPIQCTCASLTFLKVIPTQDIVSGKKFFRGTCANTGQTIKDYLVNTLPTCQ